MEFTFKNADWKTSPILIIAGIVYFSMLLTFVFIDYTIILYLVSIFAFLIIATFIFQSDSVPLINTNFKNKFLIVFGATLLLRWIILYQDQIVTMDIISYTNRARFMLDGQVPYRDFYGGSKPPLYNYMLYMMGVGLGPDPLMFRGFFSLIDAFVALTLFFAGRDLVSDKWGYKLGLIYALSPLNLITIGLSGHYEPAIIVFLIPAFIFLFRKQYIASSLCLGIAFAFKIFPVIILPFILVTLNSWKDRISYVIFFSIPMALSLVPLLIISPDAIGLFIGEESGWGGALSFSFLFFEATGKEYIFGLNHTWVIMGILMLIVLFMFHSWIYTKDKIKHVQFWFKIMVIITISFYSIKIPIAFIYYDATASPSTILLFLIIPLAVFYIIAIVLFKKFWHYLMPAKINDRDPLIITSIFAIMLFILGIPNFAPWYMLWYLPLLLMVKTDKIRMTILWLMLWHHTGVGVTLLPGLFPVN